MAPRKKRLFKTAVPGTRKTRSGVIYQPIINVPRGTGAKKTQEHKEKTNAATLNIQKIIEPMVTRSHKKFDKFRSSSNDMNSSDKDIENQDDKNSSDSNAEQEDFSEQNILYEPEKLECATEAETLEFTSDTSITNTDMVLEPTTETITTVECTTEAIMTECTTEAITTECSADTLTILDKHKFEDVDNDLSSDNESEYEFVGNIEGNIQDIIGADMDCVQIHNAETETSEITEQLSALNVSPTTNPVMDLNDSNVHIENIEFINEDIGKTPEIYHVDNLESEIVFECISEEVIPIGEEQEVEVEISNDSNFDIRDEENSIDEIILQSKDETLEQEEQAVSKNQDESEGLVLSEEENIDEIVNNVVDYTEETVTTEDNDTCKVDINNKKCEPKSKKSTIKTKTKGMLTKQKSIKIDKSSPSKKSLSESSVRRSSRIKSISVLKQKCRGHGLVKRQKGNGITARNLETDTSDTSNSGQGDSEKTLQTSDILSFAPPNKESDQKPVKVKSRWRRSSELEMSTIVSAFNKNIPTNNNDTQNESNNSLVNYDKIKRIDEEVDRRLKQFVHLKENQYLTERISCKEAKKMTCDCFLTGDETERGEYGCGEDCLNRLLMIECGNLCACGDRCTNKRFQKGQFAPCEVFRTDKKGLGIRASANIPYGDFILEYVGEVLDPDEFEKRATEYSKDKNQHYYFMSLRADAVIDATQKGNISRFINHSCDPNAETQKWTVNGELRIGFFSKRTILAGEEITFDYQFQRYGKEAQKCFCEAAICRGWLGEEPDEDDEDEDDEDEEEVEEEGEEVQINDKLEPIKDIEKIETVDEVVIENTPKEVEVQEPIKREPPVIKEKRKPPKQRKPRKDIFEDLDLDDEIETLQTTGLKNQAHTLNLSRLMVRAKEPAQRTKLLRLLRRGEFPCRRLFLDYHGLRLIHGWMTDAQHMARHDKKLESLRLEVLQTLATLPIPNKTMLQDSKVLPTVEKWSVLDKCDEGSSLDSDSNSPKPDGDNIFKNLKEIESKQIVKENINEIDKKSVPENYEETVKNETAKNIDIVKDEDMDISPIGFDEKDTVTEVKEEATPNIKLMEIDYQTEIIALALKLLEEWSNLKEVFRIPKKERIEQMKEHEREADRKYRAGLGSEQEALNDRNSGRYRLSKREKKREKHQKEDDRSKTERKPPFNKPERRKIYPWQVEQDEADRRRKQREMWRQHEERCSKLGTDPRFTAPYDPKQEFHCIWDQQIGQWLNFPVAANQSIMNSNIQNPLSNQQLSANQSLQNILNHLSQQASSQHLSSNPPSSSNQQILSTTHSSANQQLLCKPHSTPNQQLHSNPHSSSNEQSLANPHSSSNPQLISNPHLSSNQQMLLNQQLLSNPLSASNPQLHSTQNLPKNQHVPMNQPPPLLPNQHVQLNQHLGNQKLPNNRLSLNQHLPTNSPLPNQNLQNPHIQTKPLLSNSHITNQHIFAKQHLPQYLSPSPQFPPNLTVPPNINILSNLNVPPPTNVNVPPNHNLPPTITPINIPPIVVPNINIPPNMNIPSNSNIPHNQHMMHNQQLSQHLNQNQHLIQTPQFPSSHLPSNIMQRSQLPPNTHLHPNLIQNQQLPPNQHLLPNLLQNPQLPPNLLQNQQLPSNQQLQSNLIQNQQLPSGSLLPTNLMVNQQMPLSQNLTPSQNVAVSQSISSNVLAPTSQSSTNNHYSNVPNIISNFPPLPASSPTKPLPPLPALPYQDSIKEKDLLQVKFMGPIPPPVKLPPKWKCAKDKYGRPYYYHIKIRKSQWEPPELLPEENNEEMSDDTSSSETSSISSDSSSDDSDNSDFETDDASLLLQIKDKIKHTDGTSKETDSLLQRKGMDNSSDTGIISKDSDDTYERKEKSLDDRLIEEFCLLRKDVSTTRKRRIGLVQEILISPRTEEDRAQFKEDVKRYKQNKEKLKRQKELILEQTKKQVNVKVNKPSTSKSTKSSKKHKITVKTRLKEMVNVNSESVKKIKESFRSSMAGVMVSILNAYRKPECKEGRITNTEDFKHLARKLTHFVMLKELKHCQNIEDLTCTESVKSKAKEFVRKYMSKFGETYQRPKDEVDY